MRLSGFKNTARLTILIIAMISVCLFAGKAFRPPVKIPVSLSATLGEIRGNSLHQGIDIKTSGRIGYPVFAASSGKLARFISKDYGYGNAVFLDHGGGMQTVYGHLDAFEDERFGIDTLARTLKVLYNNNNIDFTLYNSVFDYGDGSIIARTGESGSGFPHIHFEIREKERFQNPLRYMALRDKNPPVLENLYLCVLRDGSTVSERQIRVNGKAGVYSLAENPVRTAGSEGIFFKISCYDTIGAINRAAVYGIRLAGAGKILFERRFDSLGSDEINSGGYVYDISKSMIKDGVSYSYFVCERAPSGGRKSADGYIDLKRGEKNFRIEVRDFGGNVSALDFRLAAEDRKTAPDNFVPVKKGRRYSLSGKTSDVMADLYQDSLSSDMLFKIEDAATENITNSIAELSGLKARDVLRVVSIMPFDCVYNNVIRISINKPSWLSSESAGRVLIFRYFEGRKPFPLETKYYPERGVFEAYTNTNGYFVLMRDRVPPKIILPPTHEFCQDRSFYRKLRFQAVDNISRIDEKSALCIIDGESFPCGFDTDREWVEVSLLRETIVRGIHHVFVSISDNAGNRTIFRDLLMFN